MNKILSVVAIISAVSIHNVAPVMAQVQEVCLTQTIFGEDINPMCFVPESISSATDDNCWHHFAAPILVCGDPAKRPVIIQLKAD